MSRSIKAGRTAVVTVAALGIGRATVRCLAELGLRVVMIETAPAALAARDASHRADRSRSRRMTPARTSKPKRLNILGSAFHEVPRMMYRNAHTLDRVLAAAAAAAL